MSIILPVILCGGEGARLWPASHTTRSKIFLKMTDGRTLLRHALDRAALISQDGMALAVTSSGCAARMDLEYPSEDLLHLNKLIEPVRRNTGPALATAALHAAETFGEDTVIVSLPADHLIADEVTFARQIEQARRLAERGDLVIFGIEPSAPLTSYGYIEHAAGRVRKFHEKPDSVNAQRYFSSGDFLWNSGMVVATARTLIAALDRHAPDLMWHCRRVVGNAAHEGDCVKLDASAYVACPSISFDHAVLEKSGNVQVIKAGFDWQDVGNWDQMGRMVPADGDGNHVSGNATLFQTNNCIVQAGERPVGIVGLDNIVVVDSPEGLLVVHADAVEQVKSLFHNMQISAQSPDLATWLSESSADVFPEKP